METFYMIVGCKGTVEHSVPHIPFVDGVDWVGVSLSNPCPLKIGDKSVETVEKPHPRQQGHLVQGQRHRLF